MSSSSVLPRIRLDFPEGLNIWIESLETNCDYDKIDKIEDGIYLTSQKGASRKGDLQEHNITHIINCANDSRGIYFPSDFVYKWLAINDSPTQDIQCFFLDVIDFVTKAKQQNGHVLFHCQLGVSRSATLVIAYLMWEHGWSCDETFQYVQHMRLIIDPNIGFLSQLQDWEEKLKKYASHNIFNKCEAVEVMMTEQPKNTVIFITKEIKTYFPFPSDSCVIVYSNNTSMVAWHGRNCDKSLEIAVNIVMEWIMYYLLKQPNKTILEEFEGSETDDFLSLMRMHNIAVP